MKEINMRVSDEDLALEWYKHGLFSLNDAIDSVEDKNAIYGFNLKNRDEELTEEETVAKMAIKYNNVCLVITSALEHMMKAVLIGDKYVHDRVNFNRQTVVFDIMRNVRNSYRRNGHDFEALIRYIEATIDPNFSQKVASEYAAIRGDTRFYNTVLSPNSAINYGTPQDRIDAATQEYTQGFIEFRYLFEKDEQYRKNVDLIKLIHYALAIQETCLNLLKRLHLVIDIDSTRDILAAVPKKSVETMISEAKNQEVKDAISILVEEAAKEGIDLIKIIQKANTRYLEDAHHSIIDNPYQTPSARSVLLDYGTGKTKQEVQKTEPSGRSLREELEKLFEFDDTEIKIEDSTKRM